MKEIKDILLSILVGFYKSAAIILVSTIIVGTITLLSLGLSRLLVLATNQSWIFAPVFVLTFLGISLVFWLGK